MKKEKDYTLLLLFIVLAISVFATLASCSSNNPRITEDLNKAQDNFGIVIPDTTWFHNGEVLLPDYAHADTLVVTDAKFLNKELILNHYGVEGDGDISDLLHAGSRPYSAKQYRIQYVKK